MSAPVTNGDETDGEEFFDQSKTRSISTDKGFGHFQPKQASDVFAAPGITDFEEYDP